MTGYELTQQKIQELRQFPEIITKYDKPGIYSISILDKLVYIGKSTNMLNRISAHIVNMDIDKAHKYKILKQAQLAEFPITFGVLYEATSDDIEEEIGQKEGELIRQYMPCLNMQIPKEDNWHSFTINKTATSISLLEITTGQK